MQGGLHTVLSHTFLLYFLSISRILMEVILHHIGFPMIVPHNQYLSGLPQVVSIMSAHSINSAFYHQLHQSFHALFEPSSTAELSLLPRPQSRTASGKQSFLQHLCLSFKSHMF